MLADVLTLKHEQFSVLADAWIAAGATCFSVWKDDDVLASWPAHRPLHPHIVAPIRVGTVTVGYLGVTGVCDPKAQLRLVAEAGLIAHILTMEEELQHMTATLVDSQDRLLAVYEFTRSIRGHATIENTLHSLTFEALRVIKAERSFAIIVADTTKPLLVQYPRPGLDETTLWNLFWETHIGEHILLPGSLSVEELPGNIRNVLIIPTRVRKHTIGALGIINKLDGEFTTADSKIAKAIVDQVSTQIENVLLSQEIFKQARLQAEIELARHVQFSLLPQQPPVVAGLDIFAVSRTAFQVGGDFYDLISRPNRPFMVSVGDITGKGLPAAMLMTMVRTAIHSKASFMPEPTPEVVMQHSSEDLYDDFAQMGMFATVLVGQYQPQYRQFIYTNAGHSPVIYRPIDGQARLLKADGPALGVLPMPLCQNQTISLRPGDLLIIATDGISDARNASGEPFGYERLLQLIEALSKRSAHEIASELFEAIGQFEDGCPQEDDQTLVVIKGAEE